MFNLLIISKKNEYPYFSSIKAIILSIINKIIW